MRVWLVVALWSSPAVADPAHIDGALHVGYHSTDGTDGDLTRHTGNGTMIDAEVGWRAPNASISAFISYAGMHTSGQWADSLDPRDFHEWDRFIDVGVRGRLHLAGAFVGVALAVEQVAEGSWTSNSEAYVDAHAGYTTPQLDACRCALEAMVSAGRVARGADYFEGTSYRFTLGVRLR